MRMRLFGGTEGGGGKRGERAASRSDKKPDGLVLPFVFILAASLSPEKRFVCSNFNSFSLSLPALFLFLVDTSLGIEGAAYPEVLARL